MLNKSSQDRLRSILENAKQLAIEYYEITNRPLGITGEVAEFEACELLGLTLGAARQKGFDATKLIDEKEIRYQIKGRCSDDKKKYQRLGAIKHEDSWDYVLFVWMTQKFEVIAIYQANKNAVLAALNKPGSKARNDRRALSLRKFISIAEKVWPIEQSN